MNLLAMFLAAMTGPGNPKDFKTSDYTGCKMTYWKSEWCSQVPGQPAPVCDKHASRPHWECNNYHPSGLQSDHDFDLDVDLRDFAKFQNRWTPMSRPK